MALANVNRPNGFVPLNPEGKMASMVRPRPVSTVRHASSGGNASTDMAVGDAYALDAAGTAYRAGPNDVVRGVVWGFRVAPNPNVMGGQGPVSIEYVTGSTALPNQAGVVAYILGVEDPTTEFAVCSDTFAQNNVGGSFNLADAAPDAKFRVSNQTLNIGSGAGTQFQAIDIVTTTADNAYGQYAVVKVRILQALAS